MNKDQTTPDKNAESEPTANIGHGVVDRKNGIEPEPTATIGLDKNENNHKDKIKNRPEPTATIGPVERYLLEVTAKEYLDNRAVSEVRATSRYRDYDSSNFDEEEYIAKLKQQAKQSEVAEKEKENHQSQINETTTQQNTGTGLRPLQYDSLVPSFVRNDVGHCRRKTWLGNHHVLQHSQTVGGLAAGGCQQQH